VLLLCVKAQLDGKEIYDGCCQLKIIFSRNEKLTVTVNNERTFDYTNSSLPSCVMRHGLFPMFLLTVCPAQLSSPGRPGWRTRLESSLIQRAWSVSSAFCRRRIWCFIGVRGPFVWCDPWARVRCWWSGRGCLRSWIRSSIRWRRRVRFVVCGWWVVWSSCCRHSVFTRLNRVAVGQVWLSPCRGGGLCGDCLQLPTQLGYFRIV